MYILLIMAMSHMGGVAIPITAEFETKKACEQAAAWYNSQKANINAICIKDKANDNDTY